MDNLRRTAASTVGALLAPALLTAPAWAATSTTYPVASDAYVRADERNANYGERESLTLDRSPRSLAYLRFHVAAPGPIAKATLRLYVRRATPRARIDVRALSGRGWRERRITFSHAPRIGKRIGRTPSLASHRWASVDVTSLARNGGFVGIALTTRTRGPIYVASGETHTRPKLEVRFADPFSILGPVVPPIVLEPVEVTPALTGPPQLAPPDVSPSAGPPRGSAPVPTGPATGPPTGSPGVPAAPTPRPSEPPVPPSGPSPPSEPPTSPTPAPSEPPAPPSAPPPSAGPPSPPAQPPGYQPSFPIRAAFYYPWFPEAWTQNGIFPYTRYHPSNGFFRSDDPTSTRKDIQALEYGGVEAAIASWWGQGSKEDRRISSLLGETNRLNSRLRWTIYYENESLGDPTAAQIESDLSHIKSQYASDPAFLHVGDRPVIFVYADGADACGMADRWKQANVGQGFYLVLKVFPGFAGCTSQPDSWHQYSPAVPADRQPGHSYAISPGFWLADAPERLPRDLARFRQNVRDMVASGESWQLVTTFNEWGEGTSIQSATEWESPSGFGSYLDALHGEGAPADPPPPPAQAQPQPQRPPQPQPPPPSSNGDPVIAAAGDISCASGCASARMTSDLLVNQGLAGVLTLGDNQYESGALSAYNAYYDPTWGRVKSITFPSPGNHDPPGSGYSTYWGRPAYYSFDLGGWHFISLDSNDVSVDQVSWLKADLAANAGAACTLAYWHHPRFTSGSTHGDQTQVAPFWEALQAAGADVVLNGHEHNYERFAPQSPSGASDPSQGIREFVVGTGGKSHYPISSRKPNSEVQNGDTWGVLKLTLHAGSYDWRFEPEPGSSFTDSGSGNCH